MFRATRRYEDRNAGTERRHHLHETVVQRAMADAVRRAGIAKHATCHCAHPARRVSRGYFE